MLNPYLSPEILDSGALSMLTNVVHQFSQPGYHQGTVTKGGQAVAQFHLLIDANYSLPQTNIDLAAVVKGTGQPCANCPPGTTGTQFTASPKGNVLFYLSQGEGGYAVIVESGSGANAVKVFDSQNLQPGDVFLATAIQAGDYTVTNLVNQQTHDLKVVVPPSTADKAYVKPTPVLLTANSQGFSQAKVQTEALQTKAYQIDTPSRIQITLSKGN